MRDIVNVGACDAVAVVPYIPADTSVNSADDVNVVAPLFIVNTVPIGADNNPNITSSSVV